MIKKRVRVQTEFGLLYTYVKHVISPDIWQTLCLYFVLNCYPDPTCNTDITLKAVFKNAYK